MKIPVIHGIIDRRILANYRIEPEILAKVLPPPFRPKIIHGVGIAGICLIRLKHIKPQFISGEFGLSSENAAHRIAIEWTENGDVREGVYIPRRDTSSKLNTFVGGKLFPGIHHPAQFNIQETTDHFHVSLKSEDGKTHVLVEGDISSTLPGTSTFTSLAEASAFFENGSLGYSATDENGEYDGLELKSLNWKVEPLTLQRIESSFFDDQKLFPKGAIHFDCALLMRNIQHEWYGRETLCVSSDVMRISDIDESG